MDESHLFQWTLETAKQLSIPSGMAIPPKLHRRIYSGIAVYLPSTKEVRELHLASLPRDPMTRFAHLFKLKKKWTEEELKPFLAGLVSSNAKKGKGLDALLLKYTRTQTGPRGETLYTGRGVE